MHGPSHDLEPFAVATEHSNVEEVDKLDEPSDTSGDRPDRAPTTPPADLSLRLEVREVARITDMGMPALMGAWAWLLSHDDGKLISYSDGYESRSACVAAARRVGWPVVIVD